MIKKVFNIDNKWKVIVYYNVDYNLFHYIANDANELGMSGKSLYRVYKIMKSKRAKAVTISFPLKKCSIVCFNIAKDKYDLINSIAHEAVHIMEAMLKYYDVNIKGEPPAYTIGHLVQILLEPLNLI